MHFATRTLDVANELRYTLFGKRDSEANSVDLRQLTPSNRAPASTLAFANRRSCFSHSSTVLAVEEGASLSEGECKRCVTARETSSRY